jgi:hypothetical protein
MANKFFRSVLGLLTLLTGFTLIAFSQTPEQKPKRTCTGPGCDALSRAELFIKTFASSGNSKGLRTSDLEQEQKVQNSFWQIDSIRRQVETGRMSQEDGDRSIDGFETQIRDYIHDKGNDAYVLAATGQASDIPAISKHLSGILGVARQDALMGREELAQEAQAKLVNILTTFSEKFAGTCERQSFPVEIALALERQNELMGTGISVIHCANRKFTADFSDLGLKYHYETCSDLSPVTVWIEKISGHVGDEGGGGDVNWEEKIVYDKDLEGAGTMQITEEEVEDDEGTVKVPNDAGPNAKPNGWASAPIPNTPARHLKKKRFMKIRKLPLSSFSKGGVNVEMLGNEPWMEAEIKSEDKPCSPVTEP